MWNIKPGSVPYDDPKFIWVEMFDRPVTNAAVTIRNKFNKGINHLAQQRKHHHIMIIESLREDRHFEPSGKLNYWGKLQFWKELDYHINQFNRKKTSLSLRNFTSDHSSAIRTNDLLRHGLRQHANQRYNRLHSTDHRDNHKY